MNILIDIGHPAHVHLFKNFALETQKKGHIIFFTCREKEFEISLLERYGFKYKSFGKKYKSIMGKIWGMAEFDIKEFLAAINFKPDIFLSHGSMYAAHASALLRKPHVSFEDTFNTEQTRLYLPFTDTVLTGNYEHPSIRSKEIQYAGYHELSYLHPNYFKPDITVLNELDIEENEKHIILRFISWQATHDSGHRGISFENKLKAVKEFKKSAKVFISSESELPPELESYRINIPPHRMHNAIAFASLLFGESATMASEAAVLGTPAIYLDNEGRGYTDEEEKKYELVINYTESESDQLKAIEKGVELINTPNLKEEWQKRRQKMLNDKIDVTAFLVWFVENYPESFKTMKENPDYQYRFR